MTHTHTDNFRASVLSDPRLESFDAVVCFSPLRWAFVFQRPRHLMTRFSKAIPVYFFAEPIVFADSRVLRPELPVALHRLATVRAPGPRKLVNIDYREVVKSLRRDRLIHTGPIDEFFNDRFGPDQALTLYRQLSELDVRVGQDQRIPQSALV